MQIWVEGKMRELAAIDENSGCEWTEDLIGNVDGFDGYDEIEERHLMSQETFDWWEKFINRMEEINDKGNQVLAAIGDDPEMAEQFHRAMSECGDNDMEAEQDSQFFVIEEWTKKMGVA